MTDYEILKYAPENYNEEGVYTKEEWTNVSDIGRCFDGKELTISEYLTTEQRHINVVLAIMSAAHCKYLTVSYVELYPQWALQRIKREKNLKDSSSLCKALNSLKKRERIHISLIPDVIRLLLREYVYLVLYSKAHKLRLSVGYDYYMYLSTNLNEITVKEIVEGQKLYLNPRG